MKVRFLTALAVGALAGPVMADSIGPGGTFVPGAGFGIFKTPPLANSDVAKIPISFHKSAVGPAGATWAGVRFHINIVDPNEAVFLGFKADPASFFSTGGPAGSTTVWVNNADQSGASPPISAPTRLGSFNVHVTGSTPLNNSDIDLTFKTATLFNIYHVGTNPGSKQMRVEISDWVYVPPGGTTSEWGQGPPQGPGPPPQEAKEDRDEG